MKTLLRILFFSLLTLTMVGCDSIFLKKGKGVIRFGNNEGVLPSSPNPPDGEGGEQNSEIEVTAEEGILVIRFSEPIGMVKLLLTTRMDSTEVWSTWLDSSLGRVEVEIPSEIPSETYNLILENEAGEPLCKTTVYIG